MTAPAPVTIEAKPDGKLLVTSLTGPEDKGLIAVYWCHNNTEAHFLPRARLDREARRLRRLRAILAPVYRLAEDTGVPVETILAAIR